MAADDGYFDIGQYTGARPAPVVPQQSAPQDFLPPTPPPQVGPTAAPQGGVGMNEGLIPTMVKQAEAKIGRRLLPDELNALGETVKAQHLPALMPKGTQQWQFEQAQQGFTSAFDQYANDYLNANTPGAPAPGQGGQQWYQHVTDPAAAAGAGVAKGTVGGFLNLTDMAARNINGIIEGVRSYPELVRSYLDGGMPGYKKGLDRYFRGVQQARGDRTFLGDWGDAWNKGADTIRDAVTSDETIADRTQIRNAWADDKVSVPEAIITMMRNPEASVSEISEVAGGFIGPGGLLKLKKAATFLGTLSPGMRRLAGATVIGAPQAANSVQDWASSVDQIPFDQLMQIEENQELAKELRAIVPNIDDVTLEKAVRDRTRGAGYDAVAATSMLANVGLAALPFFKSVEARFAGAIPAGGSRVGGALATGGSEAIEESLASGLETFGQNVGANMGGQDVPLSRNVLKSGAQGGVMGFLAGAPTGLALHENAPQAPAPTPGATPAPGATPGAPTPTPGATGGDAVPATSVVQASDTPNPEFEKIKKTFTSAIKEDARTLRGYKGATLDVAGLVLQAENDARNNLGDTWATLDRNQQLDLVATVAEAANKTRGKKALEGVEEAVAALRTAAAPVAPATPAEVPLTEAEAQPDVPEFDPNAQPAAANLQQYAGIPAGIFTGDDTRLFDAAGKGKPGVINLAEAGFKPEEIAAMQKAGMADAQGNMGRNEFTTYEVLRKNYGQANFTHVMSQPAPAAAPAEAPAAAPGLTREQQLAQLRQTAAAGTPVTASAVQKLFKLNYAEAAALAEEASTPIAAAPTAEAPAVTTPTNKLKQPTKEQKELADAQGFMNAVINYNKPADASTEGYRDRPEYGAMVEALRAGKFSNLGEFRTQLKAAQKAVSNKAPAVDWTTSGEGRTQRIGDLIGMKGRLKAAVLDAKRKATVARTALISMGMKPEEVDALNLKGAQDAYYRLWEQGARPAAGVARPDVPATEAPATDTPATKVKQTKGNGLKKQRVTPDGTVPIGNTKPEPLPVAGVNPLIQELKDKDGRRITRGQQIKLQSTWDEISRTNKGSAALKAGIKQFTGSDNKAVYDQLFEQAGTEFLSREANKTDTQREAEANAQVTRARQEDARDKLTVKGRTAAGVRDWIANLTQVGQKQRITEAQQKEIEALYSRMLVQGGVPSTLYNAVETATGNSAFAEQAVERFNTEFEALGDTPNVLALAKLANVEIPAQRARMLSDIASEQDANWRSEDGRTALEVAVDAARRMKGDKLKAANKAVMRQAFDKEAKRPKSKAPAQTTRASGAASSQNLNPEREPSAAELAQQIDPAVVQAQVMGILGDNVLSNTVVSDLADAIVQSRLDQKENGAALLKMVNEMQREGDIDLAQAIKLRAAGKEVTLVAADQVTNQKAENLEAQENEPTDDTSDEALAARTSYLNDVMVEGAIDAAIAQPVEEQAPTLLRMIAVMPGTTNAERWLANKLAGVARGLGINVTYGQEGEHPSWGGWYTPTTNTVTFNIADTEVVLHEMMHAVTANMLTFAPTNENVRKLNRQLTSLRARVKSYFEQFPDAAPDEVKKLLKNARGPLANNDEFLAYGMTHRGLQQYLGRIPYQGERGNVWAAFKKYLSDFFAPFTGSQRSALDALIETTGQLVDMVAENPNVAIQANEVRARQKSDVQNLKLAIVNDGPPQPSEQTRIEMGRDDSKSRWLGARFVDKALGLQHVMQKLVRAGHTISKDLDISRAKILYDGLKTQYTGEDTHQVINPTTEYLRNNLLRFGPTREEALTRINKFFRNKTQLNRYHMDWLQNVRLAAGMDVQRQRILEEVSDTSGTDTATINRLRADLERLVSQHRTMTEEEYGRMKNAHYDRFKEGLTELKGQGIDEATMAPLNALMERVRNRIKERTYQSGKADPDDPWITFYDDKYYVPLKGDPASKDIEGYDFGGFDDSMSLNILNASLKLAGGTTQPLTNGVERLLSDSIAAATRAAEKSFLQTLYDFTVQFKKELGASIRVYEGRPKEGYEQISGKEKGKKNEDDKYSRMPGADGFTYSEGNMHYVVDLPKDGDLYQALTEFYADVQSWALTAAAGKVTNFLSKSYTVWKPWWTLFTALIRDVTYVPAMIGVKEDSVISGIGMMGKYYKSLLQNGMQLNNVSTAFNMIFTEDQDKMQTLASAHPNSFAAWLLRYQAAGGGTNIRSMFNSTKIRNSLTSGYDNADGLWKLALPVRLYDKWATGFGNVLENTSRVAAFRALVEDGIKAAGGSVSPERLAEIEREAAIDTKDVLNYDQQGVWSKSVNSYLAFFKVGMTSADAMRKVFTKPDGSFDKARFAKWSSVYAAIGFVGMAMTRALGGDDEEDGKDKLSKVNINTLTQNFVVYIDGKPYKLPIGLGLPQLLLGPGIIAESVMNGDLTASEGGRALYELFARNAPLRPGGLKDDWTMADFGSSWYATITPTAVQPILQVSDNTNMFGQGIHRDFTGSEQFASEQGKATTDDFWKEAAKEVREATGVDAFPETYKYLANSYLSMVPIDKLVKIDAAAQEASQNPLMEIANVQVRDPEYYYARQLNKTSDDLLPAVQEFNLRKNQYLSEGMDDKAARAAAASSINSDAVLGPQYRAYKALDKSQRSYYDERKKILRNKTLSPARRESLMKRLDADLRKAVDSAQQYTQ